MRERKRVVLADFEQDYRALRDGAWGGFSGYDRWFAHRPNNAQLVSVAIYTRLVPAFEALLSRQGGDLPQFYAEAKRLAALGKAEREAELRELAAK
jgi:predicted aminopeptidase